MATAGGRNFRVLGNDDTDLEWTLHPAKDRPLHAAVVAGIILLAVWAVVFVWNTLLLGLVGALLLLGATGRFFFATRYRLTADAVEVFFLGTRQRRPWSQLRRARRAKDGVLLTPFARKSALDGPRGLFIAFGPHEDEVLRRVRTHGVKIDGEAAPEPSPEPPEAPHG